MSLRIAIATATPHEKCETFVTAHIQRLQHVVLVLTGGSLPVADADGRWLLGTSKADLLFAFFRRVVLKQDRKAQLRRRIVQRLRAERVGVVLAQYGITAMEMLPCCQELGIPLVAHFHGFDAFDKTVLERSSNYRELFAGASGIVAVSGAMAAHLRSLGAPADRLLCNSCGVDPEQFTAGDPAASPPTFISVGRFVEKKAPSLSIAAFRRVVAVRPQARLVMIGHGPLWESCLHMVKAEGLQASVELCGLLGHAAVAARMRACRAFVQHSIRTVGGDAEGTPVAALEAMSSGLPVIATRHMGIAEVVEEGTTGLLCEEHDVATMASHMIALVDDPGRASRMGAAGRSRVKERYAMDASIARLQSFLEATAERFMHER